MMRWLTSAIMLLIGGGLLSASVQALEVQDVRVVGLFSNTAVIKVKGKQRLLKVGLPSPEGVTLVRADARMATLLIGGKQYQLGLSRDHSGGYQAPKVLSEQISIDSSGQYLTQGSINGRGVRFLVDTGATSVAMNSETARALGIDFAAGQEGRSGTASGVVRSYHLILDRVRVGEIEVRNVRAAVIEGVYPTEVLLGMSYLSHVEIKEEHGLLTLTKKY